MIGLKVVKLNDVWVAVRFLLNGKVIGDVTTMIGEDGKIEKVDPGLSVTKDIGDDYFHFTGPLINKVIDKVNNGELGFDEVYTVEE